MNKIELEPVLHLAQEAGEIILKIYESGDFNIQTKKDQSPVTRADHLSSELIESKLAKLYPDIPIISEEGFLPEYSQRKNWNRFWLVDPLDGTKEFIKRSDEFSINIALIENQEPTLGVIHGPAKKISYFAQKDQGAFKLENGTTATEIYSTKKSTNEPLRVIDSRSHPSESTHELLQNIQVEERLQMGSALKFGVLAEGRVDLYARFRPCMEWDVAAGACLLINSVEDNRRRDSPFRYNTESFKIDGFILGIDEISMAWQS